MAVDAAAERQALALSAGAALALGGAALAVAWRTGSGAVMLDAAFNLCFFAAALATLKVARLAQRPDDARYPFGYLQFEPLINLAKGLLILGVGMLALLDSSLALLRGGTAVEAGLALAYAGAATLGCGGTLLILRRLQRRAASPLVQGDIENWTVNTAISAGMVLAFAFLANYSGLSATLALALAHTGSAFTFFSPFLGWLGVFLTGSDTSANALFAALQANTAHQIGVSDVLLVAVNTTGGVTGKMISPQSIAIACAAVGLVGKESDLFRFTVRHSLPLCALVGIITTVQAYLLPWMIP